MPGVIFGLVPLRIRELESLGIARETDAFGMMKESERAKIQIQIGGGASTLTVLFRHGATQSITFFCFASDQFN